MKKRNIRVTVRLSEEEYAKHESRRIKTGLSREAYIRNALDGIVLKEKPDERFFEAIKGIAGIANNVNQLARIANASGSIQTHMLQTEAEKWSKLQTGIREVLLLPEKM